MTIIAIKQLMKEKRVSQVLLAKKTGYSRGFINRVLHFKEVAVTDKSIEHIYNVLKIDL